ncbi:MAG: desulfoferrodoxin family protein [Halothiobacillus sp.]
MKRREFMTTALAGTAVLALSSQAAHAAPHAQENVVFDAQNPGHWKSVEALHVPIIERKGSQITIRTPHPMSEDHYIVSHTVVLAGGKFLDRKTFSWKDQPVSEHTLPTGYTGKITITSTCNLHDFWIKETQV